MKKYIKNTIESLLRKPNTDKVVVTSKDIHNIPNKTDDYNRSFHIRNAKILMAHVKNNDLPELNHYILHGVDVNSQDEHGRTVLHKAATLGNIKLLSFLIKRGADVNLACNNGYNALHAAAQAGNLDCLEHLIEKGAKIDAKDNMNGNTAFFYAVDFDYFDCAQSLLDAGANINHTDNHNQTVLHHKCQEGNTDAIHYLFEQGIDYSIKNRQGKTALDVAKTESTDFVYQAMKAHIQNRQLLEKAEALSAARPDNVNGDLSLAS